MGTKRWVVLVDGGRYNCSIPKSFKIHCMPRNYFTLRDEESILRVSIAATIIVAVVGIVLGLMARSSLIIFDSIYEMADVFMTYLALLVARLIHASTSGGGLREKLAERFTMGFWHLEPIVLALNGILLMAAAIYALINAADSLLAGGRHIMFGYAVLFAAFSIAIEATLAWVVKRANKTIRSDMVALDAKSWTMSAMMSVAYLLAFGFGYVVQYTPWHPIVPFIDPVVLILVCLVLIPLPVATVRRALSDILLVTPADLMEHVENVAEKMVQRYEFDDYFAYVARVGRGRQIELYFLVPVGWPAKTLEEWDRIRDEISEKIGNDTPHRWLTIVFTTDPEWAQ